VVVHQDERARAQVQGALDHLARVNRKVQISADLRLVYACTGISQNVKYAHITRQIYRYVTERNDVHG
jgi:hypothetical protein